MSALLPCPFCGSTETFTKGWHGENGGSFALSGCSRCGARTQDHWPDEARAASEWNRRAPEENNASSPSGASAGNSATDELFALKSRIDVEGMARIVDPEAFKLWSAASGYRAARQNEAIAKAQALRTLILGEEVEEQYSSSVSLPSAVASDARTETPSPAGKDERCA